jgi:hypothetical protein
LDQASRLSMSQCIVHYPTNNTGARSTPGLELVATSRVESLNYLTIGNRMEDLIKQQLTYIGTTKAYDARKAYLRDIKQRALRSKVQRRRCVGGEDYISRSESQ